MAAQQQVLAEEKVLNEAVRLNRTRKVCAQHAPRLRASNDCAVNKFGRWLPDCNHSADDFIGEQRKKRHGSARHDQYPETLPLADKEVVLAFDDGPLPPHSNKILDILTSECVKATFFIIGRMARQFPDVVRREYAAGYTIGAHSQNHPLRSHKLSGDHLHHEIDDGIASVRAALSAGLENASGHSHLSERLLGSDCALRRFPRQIDTDKVSNEEIQDIVITANLTPKMPGLQNSFQAILKELGKDMQIRFT